VEAAAVAYGDGNVVWGGCFVEFISFSCNFTPSLPEGADFDLIDHLLHFLERMDAGVSAAMVNR
jgi:hypothetical protein